MPQNNKSEKASDKKALQRNNANTSNVWWSAQQTSKIIKGLPKIQTNSPTSLPGGAGSMITFKDKVYVKLQDARLLSAVDDNNKLCLSLDDEQWEFFNSMSEALDKSHIARLKLLNPDHSEAEFWASVRSSEQTDNKYLKTKVQLLGSSRTMGCDLNSELSTNVPATLSVVGSCLSARIRVDGVYLTKDKCGIITKVDMFKMKSAPSEEEVEAERDAKRRRMDENRLGELMNDF